MLKPSQSFGLERARFWSRAKPWFAPRGTTKAAPKFVESQKLDPSAEALTALAQCLELEGKIATAWLRFGQISRLPPAARRPDLERAAVEHIRALEPRIPRLQVIVHSESAPTEVRLNGDVLGAEAWSTPLPLDPGSYEVAASAAGKQTFRLRIDLGEGEQRVVEIPALRDAPATIAGTPQPTNTQPGVPVTAPKAMNSTQRAPAWSQQKTAFLLGAAGAVSLGVGGYFGLRAISKRSASDPWCPTDHTCDPTGTALNDEAKTAARISDIGFGLGLASIGLASYLWLTADGSQSSRIGSVPIHVAAGPQSFALSTGGSW